MDSASDDASSTPWARWTAAASYTNEQSHLQITCNKVAFKL